LRRLIRLSEAVSQRIGKRIEEAFGHGEIAFGAMQAGLDLEYSPSTVLFFTRAGFDEMG
jgi:hypothetical protein